LEVFAVKEVRGTMHSSAGSNFYHVAELTSRLV
jgi:hypothetical protein